MERVFWNFDWTVNRPTTADAQKRSEREKSRTSRDETKICIRASLTKEAQKRTTSGCYFLFSLLLFREKKNQPQCCTIGVSLFSLARGLDPLLDSFWAFCFLLCGSEKSLLFYLFSPFFSSA
jgi:hypothetical protein